MDKFSFTQKILVYVKDEGSNLQTCASALNSIILCASLAMMEPLNGSCFGHALSKVSHYAIINEEVAHGFVLCIYKDHQS